MKKPSELFEGENSSLRKTFEKYCTTDNFSAPPYEIDTILDFFLSRTVPKADLLEWIMDRAKRTKSVDYVEALSDLKKFISGE